MTKQLAAGIYLLAFLVAIDYVYLTSRYKEIAEQIAAVQRVSLQFRAEGAAVVYLALAILLAWFAIGPGYTFATCVQRAFGLGVLTYAIWHGTNYAIFKKWSLWFAVTDTLWGGLLSAIAVALTTRFV